jgi:tagatose 6-phosphate kinase
MIVTITLNPSIDKRYEVADIIKGKVIRAEQVENTAGGKGLNVSRVIRLLGETVTATGFLGGKSGEFIAEQIYSLGISNQFVEINGETRSCLAISSQDGIQTEILEPGPWIEQDELAEWLTRYERILQGCSCVCASGSLPRNVPVGLYKELIQKANAQNVKFLLDTSGAALQAGIEGSPFFIKPNLDELEFFAGQRVRKTEDVLEQIDRLQDRGIACVVVSLGKEGAIAGIGKNKYKVTVPQIQAVNPVGSGDSLVAGFAVALQRGYADDQLLAFACACGSANAMEQGTGVVNPESISQLLRQIQVKTI